MFQNQGFLGMNRTLIVGIAAVTALVMVSCSSGSGAGRSAGSPVSGGMLRASDIQFAPAGADYMEIVTVSYNEWLYTNLDEAESLARRVTNEPDADMVAKVEAEKTLVLVFLSRGDDGEARAAIERMLDLDPTARFSPEGKYPPMVYDFYHQVKDEMPAGTMDIKTIAIGDFENNSIYIKKNDKYDFDLFRPALVHAIITDLSSSTGLKIVDRQRTEKIIEETQLVSTGVVDPQQAVRAGKLLGAHCFVFGQYMILDKKKVRIDMRVVHTATGEIIVAKQVTGEYKGKPEKFLELERELVTVIAEAVDKVTAQVSGERTNYKQTAVEHFELVKNDVKKRKNYSEAQFLVGEAVAHEEQQNYGAALTSWKDVLALDPENEDAQQRVMVLATMVG